MIPFRTLALALALSAAGVASRGGGDPETDVVGRFFAVMASEEAPTIADFQDLFGPYNEYELALQLRYEGFARPMTEAPDEELRARVNTRIWDEGDKYPSLFLCMMRRDMPELRSSSWELMDVERREDKGAYLLRVKVGSTSLVFAIPFDEHYIGRLLDESGDTIGAERFLPLCEPGDCCVSDQG